MFIFMFLTLTIGQLYFEYKLAHALHLAEISRKFILVNLAMSICISLLFGVLFPAAGMVIAAAGIASTVLSSPMYGFVEGWRKNIQPTINHTKTNYVTHKEKIHQTGADLVKLLLFIIWVLTMPFRIIRMAIRAVETIQGAVKNVTSSPHHP